jgi:hypothetical protein
LFAFLSQFVAMPFAPPEHSAVSERLVDLAFRFRQHSRLTERASNVLLLLSMLYPPTLDFVLVETFFRALLSQAEQPNDLHRVWSGLLTLALWDDIRGRRLRGRVSAGGLPSSQSVSWTFQTFRSVRQ